ncbi:NADH-quinone oxidoreductase subunit D [Desulfurobacterium sp.]
MEFWKEDFYSRKFAEKKRDDTIIVNIGPQHPATHGVLRVIAELYGEYIVRSECVLGYLHRMQEKMGEVKTYPQFYPNTGRLDYGHALAWNWAYVGAIERLMEIEVPERAEYVRVITTELNRIASHLLWWGVYILDLGAFTPVMYAFEDREIILDILQRITGSRLTYAYFRFGGVFQDIDSKFVEQTKNFCKRMRSRLNLYHDFVTENMIFRKRVEGVGIFTKDLITRYGATGPVARGSGIDYDVRRAEPYGVYDRFDFEIPVEDGCDCLARYMVRMREIEQSLNIIEQAIEGLPEGDFKNKKAPKVIKPPAGEAYFSVESARGKVGIYVASDGGMNPYRVKLRSPTYSNLSLLDEASKGMMLADYVATLGSLDLVIPEIDK